MQMSPMMRSEKESEKPTNEAGQCVYYQFTIQAKSKILQMKAMDLLKDLEDLHFSSSGEGGEWSPLEIIMIVSWT